MRGTEFDRDVRRAQRWLSQSGGMPYLSEPAWDLLVRRLRVRRKVTNRVVVPAGVVGIAGYVILANRLMFDTAVHTATAERVLAACLAVLLVALAALAIAARTLTGRAERSLAEQLPRRVSRSTAVGLPVMLGRVRTAFLVVGLSVEAAFAVALPFARLGWVGWAFPITFVSVTILMAWELRGVVDQPTIAVDASSLAVDERLRAQDAFRAISPLTGLMFAFTSAVTLTDFKSWIVMPWLVGSVLIMLLGMCAQLCNPWKPAVWNPRPLVGTPQR